MQLARRSQSLAIACLACLVASSLAWAQPAAADATATPLASTAPERVNDRLANERLDQRIRQTDGGVGVRVEPLGASGEEPAARVRVTGSTLYRLGRERSSLRQGTQPRTVAAD